MNKTLEGMARTICLAIWDFDYTPRDPLHPDARWVQAMLAARAGVGHLADNVTDEMVEAASHFSRENGWTLKDALSAALRAAAGGGE